MGARVNPRRIPRTQQDIRETVKDEVKVVFTTER